MIFYAYQTITHIAYPERADPLLYEEQMELSKDINVLYMNIRGVLDNFAWCYMYERSPELEKKLSYNQVGLFSRKFRKLCDPFSEIESAIKVHDSWERELATRRDPVAHRIPLYVPNAALTEQESGRYRQLNDEFLAESSILAFDKSDVAFDAMYNIGIFHPHFIHNPDDPSIPIYPTIPNDLAHLTRIEKTLEVGLQVPDS
ncbi:MAG: hypothetical protein IAE63_01370 [Alphaproteobacteria bacterium]|nr:hypothetical protein [Alphaproteobacteria bacterium]